MKDDARDDVWSLTSPELAARCRLIADGGAPSGDQTIRDEAKQLYIEWRDAIHLSTKEFGDDSHRASLLAALRKRTIEIILKTRRATQRL